MQEPTQGQRETVVGLFFNGPDAERAIYALRNAGFKDEQIGVAVRDRSQRDDLAGETGTKAVQGGAAGAVSGGVLGGVIGLLAGLGVAAVPGIGPVIAGGVLGSMLAGAGIGAAAGGLAGVLIGMGIPEAEARHFERGFSKGGILITVYAGGRAREAREIMAHEGADTGPSREARLASSNLLEGELRIPVTEEPTGSTDPLGGHVDTPLAGRVNVESDVDYPAWRGDERRHGDDPNYRGPERRRTVLR